MRPASPAQLERLPTFSRQPQVNLLVDGSGVTCFAGETVSSAILTTRRWVAGDEVRLRGIYCGIGVCFECVITIDGVSGARACMTPVRDGMRVSTVHVRENA